MIFGSSISNQVTWRRFEQYNHVVMENQNCQFFNTFSYKKSKGFLLTTIKRHEALLIGFRSKYSFQQKHGSWGKLITQTETKLCFRALVAI